jgi:hypothetical protein
VQIGRAKNDPIVPDESDAGEAHNDTSCGRLNGRKGAMLLVMCTILGFVLGCLTGFYGTICTWLLWWKIRVPNYDPSMDYAAAWVGLVGGAIGGVLGAILGFWTIWQRDRF